MKKEIKNDKDDGLVGYILCVIISIMFVVWAYISLDSKMSNLNSDLKKQLDTVSQPVYPGLTVHDVSEMIRDYTDDIKFQFGEHVFYSKYGDFKDIKKARRDCHNVSLDTERVVIINAVLQPVSDNHIYPTRDNFGQINNSYSVVYWIVPEESYDDGNYDVGNGDSVGSIHYDVEANELRR